MEGWLDRRGGDRGNPDVLAGHWRSAGARVLVVDRAGRFVAEPFGEPVGSDPVPDSAVFLGVGGDGAWFARRGDLGEAPDTLTLRDAGRLTDEQRQVARSAVAVLAWHDHEPRCERCHGPTVAVDGGFARRCTDCEHQVFPRIDPAMIVAVVDPDDRLLLARSAGWPDNRVSILAGFVEAGEALEETVRREVAEEVRLSVGPLRYVTSQAWPFPRSLMLAFVARAEGEPEVDGVEIAWAKWFTRDEARAAEAAGEITLSGPGSVARRLIEAWLERRLPDPDGAPSL